MKSLYKMLGTVVLLSLVVLQTSCTSMSTGSSMQIDVEVYKGPLSKEPSAQWSELLGIIIEARNTFLNGNLAVQSLFIGKNKIDGLNLSKCIPIIFEKPPKDDPKPSFDDYKSCKALIVMYKKSKDMVEKLGGPSDKTKLFEKALSKPMATHLQTLLQGNKQISSSNLIKEASDCNHLAKKRKNDIQKIRTCYKDVLNHALTISGELMTKAFVMAETHVVFADDSRLVRGIQTAFANMASEYGNQISSRADTLLKQMKGDNRRTMPLSTYLRDSGQTDFLNLYVWNHAGAPSLCEEGCLDLKEITRNRVRVVERMYQDHNWERINRVEASGQGEVSMAFIKDDVGNWNLKNFKNDPSELLQAYKELGKASIVAAQKLVETSVAGQNISGVKKALALASEAALGNGGSRQLAQDDKLITALKNRSIAELEGLASSIDGKKAKLDASIKETETAITEQEKVAKEAEKLLEAAVLDNGKKSIDALNTELETKTKLTKELSTLIEKDKSELATLKSAATPDANAITALEQKIAANKDTLSAYVQEIITIQNNISTLQPFHDKFKTENSALTELKSKKAGYEQEKSNLANTVKEATKAVLTSYSSAIDTLEGLAAEGYE